MDGSEHHHDGNTLVPRYSICSTCLRHLQALPSEPVPNNRSQKSPSNVEPVDKLVPCWLCRMDNIACNHRRSPTPQEPRPSFSALLQDSLTIPTSNKPANLVCSLHPFKPLEIYCLDCHVVICILCFVERHKLHVCYDVEKLATEFRRQITRDVVKLTSLATECKARRNLRVRKKADFLKQMDGIETAVIQRSISLAEIVEKHTNTLTIDIEKLKAKYGTEIDEEMHDLDKFLDGVAQFTSFCREVKSKEAIAVCQLADEIHTKVDEISQLQKLCGHRRTQCVTISFRFDEIGNILKFTNVIGRLHVTSKLAPRKELMLPKTVEKTKAPETKEDSPPTNTEKNPSIPVRVIRGVRISTTKNCIHGMVRLNEFYAILLAQSLNIYQRNPIVRVKTLRLPEIRYGGDVAVYQKTATIYAVEQYRGVWKIETQLAKRWYSSHDYRITLWLPSASHLATLSVTKCGRVLLLRDNKPASVVDVFDENAARVKSVQLPIYVREPRHVVETPFRSYVVSYGWSRNLVHGVCEVNVTGQTLHRFEPKARWQMLDSPSHLAIDCEGRVLVADQFNHRIVRLDSQLRWDQAIAAKGSDLLCPRRLQYSVEDQQLLVTHGCSARCNDAGNKADILYIQ